MEIGEGISFGLEFTGVYRNSAGSLGPYTDGVVNVIWSKARLFNFLHAQVLGQLVDDCGNHF